MEKKFAVVGGERWKKTFHIPLETLTQKDFDEICDAILADTDNSDRLDNLGLPIIKPAISMAVTGSDKTMQMFKEIGIEGIKTIPIPA